MSSFVLCMVTGNVGGQVNISSYFCSSAYCIYQITVALRIRYHKDKQKIFLKEENYFTKVKHYYMMNSFYSQGKTC